MEDVEIVELYWQRSENAITETANKYGKYCGCIARNILHNAEDAEECVNDTYMKAWNAIPPKRPERLSTFLGKITRNLAINSYERLTAEKRGGGQLEFALDELSECIPSSDRVENMLENEALAEALNRFLSEQKKELRVVFMRRYWYLCKINEIASDLGYSESKVKMMLLRSRNDLKRLLEKEGINQ